MENRKQTRKRRKGMPGISIMRFGFHASTSEAAGAGTIAAEMTTQPDAARCSAIYAEKPCGGLIVEGEGDWPRCERCGMN